MEGATRSDGEAAVRVPYARQTLEHPNPLARFAHRRRHRLCLDLASRSVEPGGAILDYGAGTGEFLRRLGGSRPDIRLFAFEPFMAIRHPEIARVSELDGLPPASFAAVSAFEVCEHLAPAEIEVFMGHARRLLRPSGRLLVSVPVMDGLGLPLKEASRALLFRRRSDYAPAEMLRGMLGRPVPRPADLLRSHKGFAHRDLWRRLGRDFTLEEEFASPLRALPWWLSSQRFGAFTPRRA